MSDLMLFGVLRMPYAMAMASEMSRIQFYDRAQQAADRIEELEAELEDCRCAAPSSSADELPPLPEPDHALDCGSLPFFTAEQMQEYARSAIAADRRARLREPNELRKTVIAHCNDLPDCAAILDEDGRFKATAVEIRIAVSELRAAIQAAAPADALGIPRESNDALIALARYWKLDGDWMTCKGCKRSLIASRDGEELSHASGCKFSDQQHPWAQLRKLISCRATGADRAQAGEDALVVVPEGWKLVPLVPTDEQIEAVHCSRHSLATWNELIYEYTKMVEVAPSPAAQKEGGADA